MPNIFAKHICILDCGSPLISDDIQLCVRAVSNKTRSRVQIESRVFDELSPIR